MKYKKISLYLLAAVAPILPTGLKAKTLTRLHPRSFEWIIVKKVQEKKKKNIKQKLGEVIFNPHPSDLILNHVFPYFWFPFVIHSLGERAPPNECFDFN